MKLSIGERLALLEILPQEGNFVMLKIIQKAKLDLGFSEEEVAEVNLRSENDQIKWDDQKDPNKDIEIGPKLSIAIEEILGKLNEESKLRIEFLPLYEKFVNNDEEN